MREDSNRDCPSAGDLMADGAAAVTEGSLFVHTWIHRAPKNQRVSQLCVHVRRGVGGGGQAHGKKCKESQEAGCTLLFKQNTLLFI